MGPGSGVGAVIPPVDQADGQVVAVGDLRVLQGKAVDGVAGRRLGEEQGPGGDDGEFDGRRLLGHDDVFADKRPDVFRRPEHLLAPVFDDVLDRIDWVTHQLCNYGIPQTNDVLKEYSYLILLASTEIAEAVGNLATLKNPDTVRTHVMEISRLYNLSTELLSRAILELFKTKDLLMIIKLKDIYEGMARVMEKYNDVGHALTDISRNHA